MDERSILSQLIAGVAAKAFARTAHECGHSSENWWGIPVIFLFRYDNRLPAIGDLGAASIPQLNNNKSSKGMNNMTQCQGGLKFLNLSEQVMELDQVVQYAKQKDKYFASQYWNYCA
jgi:hypothetical protein